FESHLFAGVELTGERSYYSHCFITAATRDAEGKIVSGPEDINVLSFVETASPKTFSYIYPHQYRNFTSQHGIFLDDDKRTYHVMPSQVSALDRYFDAESKDELDPGNIGITFSQFDFFKEEQEWPKFDPELPWDSGPRDQELPLPVSQGKVLKRSAADLTDEAAASLASLSSA